MKDFFKSIVVVELATVLAGPSVGMFLAEMGCKVIRFEPPQGDVTRTWKSKTEFVNKNVSAYYASVNCGKEIRTLDLNTKEGKKELSKALEKADILLENFRSDVQSKFELDQETTSEKYPHLIHAHLKGFEIAEDRVAYDVIIQAESGFMSINGEKNSTPLKMPVALMDVLAAHQLKEGILSALLSRSKSGIGGYLEASLEMSGILSLVNQASTYLNHDKTPKAIGSLHPNIAPYGEVFTCLDGEQVVLAIGSDQQFSEMCVLLGDEKIAINSKFKSNSLRLKNRDELGALLKDLFLKRNSEVVLSASRKQNIPIGAIKTIDQVLRQVHVQDFVIENEEAGERLKRLKSVAFTYSPSSGRATL